MLRRSCLLLMGFLLLPAVASSEPSPKESIVMPQIDVIGAPENLEKIAGSGEIVEAETLEKSRVFTTSEALRKVPGVHTRDEEGFGLRPNIGMRGLNPTRSTKVLLLEDGIPLTYAPYGDNASYYHPPIDRYERIEVLKGAAQTLFGPQTVGGVINYITPAPPQAVGGEVSLSGGNRDYFNGRLRLGGYGMLLDYNRKQGEGARDNTYSELDDLNYKVVLPMGNSQALTLRANYYSEDSDVTYSGLTDAEYRNFGPRYNPFKNDTFEAQRYGVSATHEAVLNDDVTLTTNVYGAIFSRDWWRQSSTTTDTQGGAAGEAFRDQRLAGNRVDPDTLNSTQGRLRKYYTWGIEPRLHVNHKLFGIQSEADLGIRAHYEIQDRRQLNGTSPSARTGTIAEDNERTTNAYSGFLQNRFILGNFTVTPGIRLEQVEYERTNRMGNNGAGVSGKTDLFEAIPSLGLTYEPFEGTTLFAGVHRGFAPPRTEDILNNSGATVEVDPEKSWNYEVGVRSRPLDGLSVQGTFFRTDFEKQIAVGSIAGGSTPLAVGETLYQGIEFSGRLDGGTLLKTPHNVYLQTAYTWLPTARMDTPFVRIDNGQSVQGDTEGNRLPYAPKHQLTTTLGYAHPSGFDVRLESVYVGEQFSDFANTAAAPAGGNGQAGKIPSYVIWNTAVNYEVKPINTTFFVAVKNLGDKDYIVDRTRGILPGSPRLIQAGLKYEF